jgi:hypothetical protein
MQTSQNFISVDGDTVRNSYGEFFTIGQGVEHEDKAAGTATIVSFEVDKSRNEIKVITDKGFAYIDFLVVALTQV